MHARTFILLILVISCIAQGEESKLSGILHQIENKFFETEGQFYKCSSGNEEPMIDQTAKEDIDFEEYGYGFWARFLTLYPQRLEHGKNAPWYFISRLTSNQNYHNIGMGDRLLGIWQGQGFYQFATCDAEKQLENVAGNINYPGDIEGLWTYFYFSYSSKESKAQAFVKYQNSIVKSLSHTVSHPKTNFLRFLLGGNDNFRYPGFNGIISQVVLNTKKGGFLGTEDAFSKHLQTVQFQSIDLNQLYRYNLIEKVIKRNQIQEPQFEVVQGRRQMFPHEYALSGWFKWEPTKQHGWHNIFRVTVNRQATDQFLGDRTLSMWLGTQDGGILNFPTYSYEDMNGKGNVNVVKQIEHKNRHLEWFFVYFGYSKNKKKAYAAIKFLKDTEQIQYENVNHFYAPAFYIYVGRDQHFPGFQGSLGFINFLLGDGSYLESLNFQHPDDIFGFEDGADFHKMVSKSTIEQTKAKYIVNAPNQKAKIEKEVKQQQPFEEYGYRYWARFFTLFPNRISFSNAQQTYFLSRFSFRSDREYSLLEIRQGVNEYQFITYSKDEKSNQKLNALKAPKDIEGLWTLFQYSYSRSQQKAIAIMKFGNSDPIMLEQKAQHPDANTIYFILGGQDQKFDGFNGLFFQVGYSGQSGAFVSSIEKFNEFLKQSPQPVDKVAYQGLTLVEEAKLRKMDDEPVRQDISAQFPDQYAMTGWFKWEQPELQSEWHSLFRVSTVGLPNDQSLGDRTLGLWLGQVMNGALHFATYSYQNMQGLGDRNVANNIAHKNRHQEWFFVYFGYSKVKAQAFQFIKWTEDQDSNFVEKINHYFSSKYYVFGGRDSLYKGFNGQMSYVAFSYGEAAFQGEKDIIEDSNDRFLFRKGIVKYFKKATVKESTAQTKIESTKESVTETKKETFKEASNDASTSKEAVQQQVSSEKESTKKVDASSKSVDRQQSSSSSSSSSTSSQNSESSSTEQTQASSSSSSSSVSSTQSTKQSESSTQAKKDESTIASSSKSTQQQTVAASAQRSFEKSSTAASEAPKKLKPEVINSMFESKTSDIEGKLDVERVEEEGKMTEYGYGFWFRYLTLYPERQLQGKSQPWYFLSRLTSNKNYENQGMGDRVLAIWQGQGHYQFATCDKAENNPNIQTKINFPDDIEGLWTYVYYSYSLDKRSAVAFLKFSDEVPVSEKRTVVHPVMKYFRLIIGGSDEKRYPAFNGQITKILIGSKRGAFVESEGQLIELLADLGRPVFVMEEVVTKSILTKERKLTDSEKPIEEDLTDTRLSQEYAFSGWFKLDQLGTQKLVQIFRVASRESPDDKFLGDRVLAGFLSAGDGGVMEYATYHYTNMIGGGNANYQKNLRHQNRHLEWHFVYFGYSKLKKMAYVYLRWQSTQDSLEFLETNHYFIPYYYLYVGKGTVHDGFNGLVSNLKFNIGKGAFRHSNDYQHVQDIFGFSVGAQQCFSKTQELVKEIVKEEPKPITVKKEIMQDQKVEKVEEKQEVKQEEKKDESKQDTKQETQKEVKKETELQSKQVIKQEIKQETKQESKQEIKQEIKSEAKQEIKQEIKQETKQEIKQETKQESKQEEIKKETKQEIKQDTKQEVKREEAQQELKKVEKQEEKKTSVQEEKKAVVQEEKVESKEKKSEVVDLKKEQQQEKQEKKETKEVEQRDEKKKEIVAENKEQTTQKAEVKQITAESSGKEGEVCDGKEPDMPQIKQPETTCKSCKEKEKQQREEQILKREDTFEFKQEYQENSCDSDKPILDRNAVSEHAITEYGYGFWVRFLTVYPRRLLVGKTAPWYFMARLSSHKEYDNIRMGDRLLAIWQGQGFYHFTTCDHKQNKPNLIQNVNQPADIEGIWTYFYFSHNHKTKRSVGFVKYDSKDPIKIVIDAEHDDIMFLRFIIGGNDQGRYPGFNGYFAKVTFQAGKGSSVDELSHFAEVLKKNQISKLEVPLHTFEIGQKFMKRQSNDEPLFSKLGESTKFPEEYSFSGWFKWTYGIQQLWHNIFRVSIKTPPTDAYLGDRTLSMWLGQIDCGVLHFPTYSYTNMIGGGNPNVYKNIQHEDRHLDWFYVYFGYSKKVQQARVHILWNDRPDTLLYDSINHFYAPAFYVFAGRDKHFPGWNGEMGHLRFNIGAGAFHPTLDLIKKQGDSFGFVKEEELPKPDNEPTKELLASSFQQAKPIIDRLIQKNFDVEEYGFGFWARFLILYPQRLLQGKNQPWYFMARLANSKDYDNIRMGDRMLALWQGQGFYHFSTCDTKENNPNVNTNVNYPADIEGLWTFIYYSYQNELAVAHLKYGVNSQFEQIRQTVRHPKTRTLQFALGGNDQGRYSGFNGIFTQVVFNFQKGAFVDARGDFDRLLEKIVTPKFIVEDLHHIKLISEEVLRTPEHDPTYKQVGEDKVRFAQEYSFSGWFKWIPTTQQPWHTIVRSQVAIPSTDEFLGDRTLCLWLGKGEEGSLQFTTYTYTNLVGAGNANYFKSILHKDRHTKWFFAYFGYSKLAREAYAFVKWTQDHNFLVFSDVNHFYAPAFHVYIGKDKHFPGFNGKMAYVGFNIGRKAYLKEIDFTHPQDIFGFEKGLEKLKVQAEIGFKPSPADKTSLESSHKSEKPLVDKAFNQEKTFETYGYGFWLRYLTVYPVRMFQGKNEPWYFISRLTSNKEYDNIKMGDRLLAIWQGQGFYHFATCNAANQNPNLVSNIPQPADIEGIWTYVYYSYSSDQNRVVAMAKFGSGKVQKQNLPTTHPMSNYLRLIIGGNDGKRYPGFNGIYYGITYSVFNGAFLDLESQLEQYLSQNNHPAISFPVKTFKILDNLVKRSVEDPGLFKKTGDAARFPLEYAFSGWFKWTPVAQQQAWHNLFRVQIKDPSTDQFLGDRTLSGWLGAEYLHFPTYTYTNMNGAGEANYHKNLNHKNRHLRWFYVYFGYSKKHAMASLYVKWTAEEEFLTYERTNHYLAPEFFIYVGRDKHFPGFNGQLGMINFNAGDGAFREKNDVKSKDNTFGFDAPFVRVVKDLFDLKERNSKTIVSGFDAKQPGFEKTIDGQDGAELTEFGYGFWCRFLSYIPQPVLGGVKSEFLFLARVTRNRQLSDIGLGDRSLGLWLGKGFYHFTTYDKAIPNVFNNVNHPDDIEGLWTFVHHAYNLESKRAVAFIKFGNGKLTKVSQNSEQSPADFLKFYLGGSQLTYKGFNGQIKDAYFSINKGIYMESEERISEVLQQLKTPDDFKTGLVTKKVVEEQQSFNSDSQAKELIIEEAAESADYAWSGWFKWTPTNQQPWHVAVRMTINQQGEDMKYLGDRTLGMWLGSIEGGVLHFSTYSYKNINGEGKPNQFRNVNYKSDHIKWHFVYFGYSRLRRQAAAKVIFKSRSELADFKDTNHFVPNRFYLYLGKDKWYTAYNGHIALFRVNSGYGSFQDDNYDKSIEDIFGFKGGKQNLEKPEVKFDLEKAVDRKIISSAQDSREPIYHKVLQSKDLEEVDQYGYGFWLRFLTHYPKALKTGLHADWSFVSRLTRNEKYSDSGLGDRTLAIWLGKGFYHFTTHNGGSPNVVANINHPTDIEGLWTFIHFSNSLAEKISVAFIKFGNTNLQKAVLKADHSPPPFLQLFVGGQNYNYPALNGQFSSIYFSTATGIFINTDEAIAALMVKLPRPEDFTSSSKTRRLIENPTEYTQDHREKELVVQDASLVSEYAWSGWFKWTPCSQQAWHLMVRLSINQAGENAAHLGDRTLSAWVGNGYLHFTTYTYTSMQGAGNTNVWQNIPYESGLTKWHFVYFGYSKTQKLAHAYVNFRSRQPQLAYQNIQHFLPNTFSVYISKDKWHAAYNGNIAHLRLNTGPGSFQRDNYEKSSDDRFAMKFQEIAFSGPVDPPVDEQRQQEIIDSAFNGAEKYKEEFGLEMIGEGTEYGYGFYIRYLQEYPVQLKFGKQAPWYIVSRMTNNQKHDNIGMGDRLLAIWQGNGIYLFVTNDKPSNNPNLAATIPFGDIDGVWTFVYFSYSLKDLTAMAIIKYENNAEVFHRELKANHGKQTFLKLLFGGKDNWYPGFNGQYANYAVKFGPTAYVKNYNEMKKYLDNRIPKPDPDDKSLKQVDFLKAEKQFKGEQQEDEVLEISGQAHLASEYSISAWIRWDQTPLPPWFVVFRLSKLSEPESVHAHLLYNDLVLYRHTHIYRFHSYSYSDMIGAGNPWIGWDVPLNDQQGFWQFVYMAYSKQQRIQYNYVKFIESEFENPIKQVNHFLVGKHFLIFGRDYRKFYVHHRGFTGAANFVRVSYGNGAFRTKPLGSESKKPDIFWYDEGLKKYQPVFDLKTLNSENNQLLLANFDEAKPVIDWQLEDGKDDLIIRGLKEYGWGMWTRWSRTAPESMPWRQGWHNLARLTNRRNHADLAVVGDRTLAVWVGWGFYYFTAYSVGLLERVGRIDYKVIDGEWIYIAFSYKNGFAKGIVIMGERPEELNLEVKQVAIMDYLRFYVGKEFGYKFFNGHLFGVILRLGEGAFMTKEKAKEIALGEWRVPQNFRASQTRRTIPLIEEKKSVAVNIEAKSVMIEAEVAAGKREYSLSGWARWVDTPGIGFWQLLYRVTIYKDATYEDAARPGDRGLNCWRGPGYFHISTYHVDEYNGGNWNWWQNIDYQGVLHKSWVFFYHGYSKDKQKAFSYVKFPTHESKLYWNGINHFVPNMFNVLLQKDRFYQGYNGLVDQWFFNVGQGSYREDKFVDDGDMRFGMLTRKTEPVKNWAQEEIFDNGWGPETKVNADVEYIDNDGLSAIQEYGYGMWTRFLWNGQTKLINKPAWLALSRLTMNIDYETDTRQNGDRALAIWVGSPYFHFTTSTVGNHNVVFNINYENMLDGQWNYIWYGYKRFPDGGRAQGHIAFNGVQIRSTSFPIVNHPPLIDYLYLAVGGSGAKLKHYHQFNGQIGLIKLILGKGGYIASANDLKAALPQKPSTPALKAIKQVVIDEPQIFSRADGQVKPFEFEDEFAGAQEYSVALWFKWTAIGRVAWEQVYTLTYNEKDIRANHAKPGDRVLSLFQYADHRQFFSSYTTPGNNDAFAHIYTECPVPSQDQTSWVFAYYAYSRQENNLISFLKTHGTTCERRQAGTHRVPRYFGLYVGKDAIHTPYNGKFSHVHLLAGPGSYRTSNFMTLQAYVDGGGAIISKPYHWDDKKEDFAIAAAERVESKLDGDLVDGQSSYSICLWTRYLTAIPKRILEKRVQSIVRLTSIEGHSDAGRPGDRTLAVFLLSGSYGFRTYNNANPNVALDIPYGKSLEGAWNFIYFSYSSDKQKAVAFVKFGETKQVQRQTFTSISHRPFDGFAKIIVGQEFGYQGFNGMISGLQAFFGSNSFIEEVSVLEALIKKSCQEPDIDEPRAVSVNIQENIKVKVFNEAPQLVEWPEQHQGALEYSVYGWFRYSRATLASPNNVILRLTNNEPAYRREFGQVGDRTLLIMLQPNEIAFATYTLGTTDVGLDHNIRKATPYLRNLGSWTYFWFGYSWYKRQAQGVVIFPTHTAKVSYENVLHMVPKYLALFAGSDGMLGSWVGPMQKVGAVFGKGAFVDANKGNFLSLLPDTQGVEPDKFEWKPPKDEIILVPLQDKPAFDVTFKDEAGGVSTYAYGLWTRWLMAIPQRINEKSPFHQLIRLTNTERYQDNAELGNRVLAVWVGKGFYHFTTYDVKTSRISISQNTDYGDYLEGHWNYIYFSFTSKNPSRAVGFVAFGDLNGEQVSRVEFNSISHYQLNGFARVVVANNEFGYPAFNGMISNLQILFNQGFLERKEQLIASILKPNPKPDVKVPERTDITVQQDEKEIKESDPQGPVKGEYKQFQGVLEYAFSGWVNPRKIQDSKMRSLFRLTINQPGYYLDKRNAGDRTLSAFVSSKDYIFSTYDYGDLDSNDDDQNDISKQMAIGEQKGEWAFLYFGYSLRARKGFCSIIYQSRQDSYLYEKLKHFIPNVFWFYIGNDGFNPQFDGAVSNVKLHFGDGAYSLKTKDFINSWPFDPLEEQESVMSVILQNQGLSSVRIKKAEQPLSGGLDFNSARPMSGQFGVEPVKAPKQPLSGNIDKAGGPKSGALESTSGAKSGSLERQTGAKSGSLEKAIGPQSGDTKSILGAQSGTAGSEGAKSGGLKTEATR